MAGPDGPFPLREFIEASRRGDEHAALALSKRVYQAFLAGEMELAGEDIDPELSWEPPSHAPTAGEYRGPDEVRAEVAAWTEPFDEFEWEPTQVISAGDRWGVVGEMRGVGRASGIEVRKREFHVWTSRNGRIVRMQMFFDRDEALEASGLSPG